MTLFFIKNIFILYVGSLQEYILDEDVIIVLKGGRVKIIARCLPFIGDGDNGDFWKA
jgi:hypothetical protein